jgi:RimJ/RimL family protein N-acetyltransferase
MMTAKPTRIESRRLVLQPFDECCISSEYLSWMGDAQVLRFSNQRFLTHSRESVAAYMGSFRDTPNLFLAIRLKDTERMIGTMTAYLTVHRTADMGLLIGDRSRWGQGYGLEAWSALMAHLFAMHDMRKVTGGALRPNIGMISIMERSGMHLEAVRARQEIVDGTEEDVLHFARFTDR